jgi:hypothetical protein
VDIEYPVGEWFAQRPEDAGALAQRLGDWRFLSFSALCGIAGALTHLAFHFGEMTPVVKRLCFERGDSVFVIEKKKDPKTGKESEALRQQVVRVGQARGDFVAILQGVKEGETVVSTGVFKLRNGMAVFVSNDLAPKPELNPNPPDS